MKKLMSTMIAVCMLIGLLSGAVLFSSSADAYETVKLKGFSTWTQAELDNTSGNNGYQHSCCTALYVETNAAYCVGGTTQAIKAVRGSTSTGYNNCIVAYPKEATASAPFPRATSGRPRTARPSARTNTTASVSPCSTARVSPRSSPR